MKHASRCVALAVMLAILTSRGSWDVSANVTSYEPLQQVELSLEKSIPALMKEKKVPGLAIALVRDSRVVWHRSFGVRNAETGAPVGDETIFEAASLSKPVFAYAVLKLVESGKLDLETPLVSYLTGDENTRNLLFDPKALQSDPLFQKVTARHVLSHTSGLPNWDRALKVYFTPGERFSYSGQGFAFLQIVVEKVSGLPLDQFMQAFVFRPLGMNSSFVCDVECKRLKAHGHKSTGEAVAREMLGPMAAASLHTTAHDYAKFLLAVINGRGLKKEMLRLMMTPRMKVDAGCVSCADRSTGVLSDSLSWGLGWGLQQTKDDRYLWHWGNNAGLFNAYTQISPKRRLGLIVLTNSGNGLSVVPEIVTRVFGQHQPALDWIKNR